MNASNEAKLRTYLGETSKGGGGMSCVPIPVERVIEVAKAEIEKNDRHSKNFGYMLMLGVFTGLRDSDLRQLRVKNLYRKDGVYLVEGKSQKKKKVFSKAISVELGDALLSLSEGNPEQLLVSNNGVMYRHGWISRKMQKAFDVEYRQAQTEGLRKGVRLTLGAHSLRKTYGLHIYKHEGLNAARMALQHDNLATTSKYLNVNEQEQVETEIRAFKGLW